MSVSVRVEYLTTEDGESCVFKQTAEKVVSKDNSVFIMCATSTFKVWCGYLFKLDIVECKYELIGEGTILTIE